MNRRTLNHIVLAAALSTALAFTTATSTGGIEVGTDPAGDANAINGQGFVTGEPHPVTDPVSYDRADLVGATFETLYTTEQVGDDGLKVTPTDVVFHLDTVGVPGSDGPTMIFRINAAIDGCASFINVMLDNPVGPPVGTASGTVQWRQLGAACPNGVSTVTNAAWTATVAGNTLSIRFPFTSLDGAQLAALGPGNEVSSGTAETRTEFWVGAGSLTAPMIDSMQIDAFVVGSDVPLSKGCTSGCPS